MEKKISEEKVGVQQLEKDMQTKNIMIVGVGGQGTLLTSRILGKLILSAGYDVKLSEVHGMAQRGGSVVTYVRFGTKVYEPIVEEGQADLLIAFEGLEAMRYLHFLKKDGVLVVNNQRIDPMPVIIGKAKYPDQIMDQLKESCRMESIDAMSVAKSVGSPKVFNTVVLGLVARHLPFSKEQWLEVIEQTVPPKTIALNQLAFLVGYNGQKGAADDLE